MFTHTTFLPSSQGLKYLRRAGRFVYFYCGPGNRDVAREIPLREGAETRRKIMFYDQKIMFFLIADSRSEKHVRVLLRLTFSELFKANFSKELFKAHLF